MSRALACYTHSEVCSTYSSLGFTPCLFSQIEVVEASPSLIDDLFIIHHRPGRSVMDLIHNSHAVVENVM